MPEELKRCWNCGRGEIDIEIPDAGRFGRFAYCVNCCARGRLSNTDEGARKAWNSRPIEDALQARIDALQATVDAYRGEE